MHLTTHYSCKKETHNEVFKGIFLSGFRKNPSALDPTIATHYGCNVPEILNGISVTKA